MKLKVCGVTNEEDVSDLGRLGVDSLGFIVSEREMPWKLDARTAGRLISLVPDSVISVVGVGDYSAAEIEEICRTTKADVVQLQRGGTIEEINRLRKVLPKLQIWKVIQTYEKVNLDEIKRFEEVADAIVIHTQEEEWEDGLKIARILSKPFVLAGGLDAKNIKRAISLFQPWMVDLIRGVEAVPGKKDLQKVKRILDLVK